ncbi:MAG TPA: NifU N-terminal domain-containing protein [Planctomycetota bacterium]
MARKTPDPLAPKLGFHPYEARFELPGPVLAEGWLTFDSPEGKAAHPGAAALLQIPGVTIVSLHRNQVTLLRDPETSWEPILAAVPAVLRAHFVGKGPWVDPATDADAATGPAEAAPADAA